jgi:hypothetical protein
MTEPTNTDKARYIVERLGLCWHEYDLDRDYYVCSCGFFTKYGEAAIPHMKVNINPTFLDPAGRIQLLELMMGREDWPMFSRTLKYMVGEREFYGTEQQIAVGYITDTTGILLDAAYQFLKEKTYD